MKKALIIYHNEDNDGLFSMAIIYHWFRRFYKYVPGDICILGTSYDKLSMMLKAGKFDNLSEQYEKIAITDVSFNEQEEMLKLYEEFGDNFYWFDHHKPIIDYSMKNDLQLAKGIRDIGHSALFNAWRFCCGGIDMPFYLKVLSAYDSFSYAKVGIDKEYATNVNQGTTNKFNLEINPIIDLVKTFIEGTCDEDNLLSETFAIGKAFNEEQDKLHDKIIKEYGDMSWTVDGQKACAVFIPGQTSSDFFKSIKDTDVKRGLIFKHNNKGLWKVSLYNINDNDHSFHCGEYLKDKYKGGGHEGAAGCTITAYDFIDILKAKAL